MAAGSEDKPRAQNAAALPKEGKRLVSKDLFEGFRIVSVCEYVCRVI